MGIGMDLEARRKDGAIFPVEIGLGGIETVDGKLGVAFITDISQRRKTEAALRRAKCSTAPCLSTRRKASLTAG